MSAVSLLNHSYYSLLDSTLSPQRVVDLAVRQQMGAVGLTDRDTLAGAVEFYKAARAAGIHPVIGSDVTLDGGARVTLLVENETGYRNLAKLLTTRVAHPGGVVWEDVARHRAGLIALLGPLSEAAQAVRRNEAPERWIERYRELFPVALVLAPHNEEDLRLSRVFAAAGRRLRVPAVAAAEVHYAVAEERLRYDILASMRTLTLLQQSHADKRGAGNYAFPQAGEMERHFGALPQSIANARLIAERCRFDFSLGDIQFPDFPHEAGLLRKLATEGAIARYGAPLPGRVRERLEKELSTIEDVGYSEYFLIFADMVRWANARGIETLARGSAAGSLVCYTLGIGNICPFRFGLCFERFLNKERMQFSKLADIDLDLPWDKRDEVIRYVFEKYGRSEDPLSTHVAMIGAVNTFQGKGAIADIAKVYGIPEREVRRFTERIPMYTGDASEFLRDSPECKHLPLNEEPYKTVLAMAGEFAGLPRHFQMHPCGVTIGARPITDLTPLFLSNKGLLTTHYAMDDVEELGLLKMDLLGQAGLSVLRETRDNLREQGMAPPETDYQDAATWQAIATGNARGVFHIESPNMTNLLVMTDCRDIDCLTAIESVIRPGAANEGRKRAFARRHQGLEPVTFAHPSLEPLLKDTYGLLVYEEHILLVANGFAGMNWGRADTLRRLLVKNKDHKKIDALGEEFRACARRRGHAEEDIERVWGMLREFAGYMFNKAHSAAYAVEAFQGAYLKMRYPAEFLASVLTNRRGFYAPMVYVLEALRNGARFAVPDVHASDAVRFTVREGVIRLPLNQVKGLSADLVTRIAATRPFGDVGDFFRRARPQHADWLALLKVGALDTFGEPRGRLFWRLSRLQANRRDGLFTPEEVELGESAHPARWEAELLGFPVSVHPVDFYAPGLDRGRFTTARDLLEHPQRYFEQTVEIAGLIVADRMHTTERGPMKFVTVADRTGFAEVSLFPETYQAYGHATVHAAVRIVAKAEPFDNRKGVQLLAERVYAWQAAFAAA